MIEAIQVVCILFQNILNRKEFDICLVVEVQEFLKDVL